MRKWRIPFVLAVIAGVFAVGLWLGVLIPKFLPFLSNQRFLGTPAVLQQVKSLSELVTVQYVIEKIIVLEDVKWIAGLGESRVLMVAHGIVKAGMDLGQLKPEDVRISNKRISIRAPSPRITDCYLDEKETRVIERTTGLLRTFDKDLEQNARQTAVEDIRRAARNAGILKEAEKRGRLQLEVLLHQMGFEEVEWVEH